MYVRITATTTEVREPDDCTRLHVEAPGLDDAAAGEALRAAGLGEPGEAGHVWLSILELRARARAGTHAPDWDERFEKMVAYARSKGWLDDSGTRLAAHIARDDA